MLFGYHGGLPHGHPWELWMSLVYDALLHAGWMSNKKI